MSRWDAKYTVNCPLCKTVFDINESVNVLVSGFNNRSSMTLVLCPKCGQKFRDLIDKFTEENTKR